MPGVRRRICSPRGEVPEWSNGAVSKTVDLSRVPGFESLPLRQFFVIAIENGEVSEWPKEHAWKACVGATPPRVRIPPSPPSIDRPLVDREPTLELGPCASPTFEPCQTRKGAALRRISASAAGRLGSMVGFLSTDHPPLQNQDRGAKNEDPRAGARARNSVSDQGSVGNQRQGSASAKRRSNRCPR